jgi:hypothetical protein
VRKRIPVKIEVRQAIGKGNLVAKTRQLRRSPKMMGRMKSGLDLVPHAAAAISI